MKLNKNELYSIVDSVEKLLRDIDHNRRGLEEKVYNLQYALEYEDEIEIEGYDQDGWIKLDPNNPKTFPPRGQYFIAYGSGHMNAMFRYSKNAETDEEFVNRFFGRYGSTHWCAAPKPPQD
jgi:hypothetical protein